MTKPDEKLKGRRVLLVEDEYLVAADLNDALRKEGATVVGPFARQADAERYLMGSAPDAAVLDIDLAGETSYSIADELVERDVPFMFVTGYDDWYVAPRYRNIPRLTKPASHDEMIAVVAEMIGLKTC